MAVSEGFCHNPTGKRRKSATTHSPVTKNIAKISDVQLLLQTLAPIFGFQVRSHEQ